MFFIPENIKVSKNFKLSEFMCKDGSKEVLYCEELISLLENIRKIIAKPIIITSGYRTFSYNKKVGGSPKSQHLLGRACDIKVKNLSTEYLAQIAKKSGAKGIGIYDLFVHVDVRKNVFNKEKGYDFWDKRRFKNGY